MADGDIDDEAARRLIAAALLLAAHDAKRDTEARAWLTDSPQAARWLEWLELDPDRDPDLSQRTKKFC